MMRKQDVSTSVFFCVNVLFLVVGCNEVKLNCSDLSKDSLTPFPSDYNCNFDTEGIVVCSSVILESPDESNATDYYGKELMFQFLIIQEFPAKCLGIQLRTTDLIHYRNVHSTYGVYFNSSIPVGVVEADEEVWRNGGACNVSVLQDVLDIFNSEYWEPGFTSSSPLLQYPYGWISGFNLWDPIHSEGILDLKIFQNSSIRWLRFFWSIDRICLIKDMPLLESIAIIECESLTIHPDSFTNTPQIEIIHIKSTGLVKIPSTIDRLTNLKAVRIEFSKSTPADFHLQTQKMSLIKNLEYLNLRGNKLNSLSGNIPPMLGLKFLYLSDCEISQIQDEDLAGVPSLEELDLSANKISLMDPLAFSYQRNLKMLRLSGNKLTSWPELYSKSLKLLDLSGNSLKYFRNLGENGTTVEYLNVSNNEIVPWNDKNIFSLKSDFFTYSMTNVNNASSHFDSNSLSYEPIDSTSTADGGWVKKLNLSNNHVTEFTEVMLESLKEIEELDIGENHFHCEDCATIPFQKWLNSTSTKVTNLGTPDPLRCSSPPAREGLILVDVKFDEELCMEPLNEWLFIGIHVVAITTLVSVIGGLIYYFRSQLTYMLHLYKIRGKARHFPDTVYNKFAFDAFICYSSHDRQFVLTKLARTLERDSANYELCLHERDFPLGSHIVSNIVGAIQHSRKTIIILSQYFIESKWCKWEMEMAHHKMFQDDPDFLIFIKVEEDLPKSKLPLHLQFLLNTRTYVEWPSSAGADEEIAFRRIKDALGSSIFQTTQERAPKLTDILDDY